MNIKILEYNRAEELNELFKSKAELEKVNFLSFELKNENKEGVIFEYKEFWEEKKSEAVISLFLSLGVITFFYLLEPILSLINIVFSVSLTEKIIGNIVIIPVIVLLYKLYQLLSFHKNLTIKKNNIISRVFNKNKDFKFSSLQLGQTNGIVYASFMKNNIPVNDGLILIATNSKEYVKLISFIRNYSEKFGIELKEKNIE